MYLTILLYTLNLPDHSCFVCLFVSFLKIEPCYLRFRDFALLVLIPHRVSKMRMYCCDAFTHFSRSVIFHREHQRSVSGISYLLCFNQIVSEAKYELYRCKLRNVFRKRQLYGSSMLNSSVTGFPVIASLWPQGLSIQNEHVSSSPKLLASVNNSCHV